MSERVCYFGAYDPSYPRNAVNRQGLRLAGAEVSECRVNIQLRTPARAAGLVAQFRRLPQPTAIIVAEFSHALVPLAWLLARRAGAALLFDPAVSMYEIAVVARQNVRPGSPRARYLRAMESLAFRAPDRLIWYTPQDRDYFNAQYGLSSSRSGVVWPGVNTALFRPLDLPPRTDGLFRVHFNGAFLPTHGVDVILHAAAQLLEYPEIQFELVGSGQTLPEAHALAERLALTNVAFSGRVPIEEIPARIAHADMCLGAFADDAKHRRLFVLKAGQAMACRRAVITGDTPALRSAVAAGEDVVVVPLDDALALAAAILDLWRNPERREQIAMRGYQAIRDRFTPEKIGAAWLEHIRRARGQQ